MKHVAALVLLAALSWFGIGRAEAACTLSGSTYNCATREEAYNRAASWPYPAQSFIDTFCPAPWPASGTVTTPVRLGTNNIYEAKFQCSTGPQKPALGQATWTTECPAGKTWNDATHTCQDPCTLQNLTGTARFGFSLPTCTGTDQCTVTWTPNGAPYVVVGSDGKPVTWQKWSGVTTPGAHCTAAPDTDGDGTPDTTDAKPADPNETKDTDGDGIGDNNDAMPNDPTNGEDTGPGDETDNASSGGGTCASPPTSTGDAIAAQIAYQTWATRCAVEKLNAATTGNGSGTTPGSGTDMTATNAKLDGIKTGTDNLAGEADLNEGSASGTIADIWSNETETPDFDMGGLGLSRSCPSPPTITLAGMSRTIDTSALCDLSEVIAALVLLMTAAHAAYIFAGRSA